MPKSINFRLTKCHSKIIKYLNDNSKIRNMYPMKWNFLPNMILVGGQLVEPWISMFEGIFKVLIGVRIQWLDRKTIHKYMVVYVDLVMTFVIYFELETWALFHLLTSHSACLLCIEICMIPRGIWSFIDIRFFFMTSWGDIAHHSILSIMHVDDW